MRVLISSKFEDICEATGSKNLQFGNINNANPPDESIPFIDNRDLPLLRRLRERAFEVHTACHELLGHGSGRLFRESSPGNFNFDATNPPLNPLTKASIQTWYGPGQTWQSVFSSNSNAIEECRADGVALILLTHKPLLEVFGYFNDSDVKADDSESNVLSMWSMSPKHLCSNICWIP